MAHNHLMGKTITMIYNWVLSEIGEAMSRCFYDHCLLAICIWQYHDVCR
ncbi:MAG: hypothetical protein IGNPGNKH_00447 [Sodalis sp. Ffu]|nr:MAG: hypothetical protein IGNPGNKH_00447 [Sodalis sp. Ffu]